MVLKSLAAVVIASLALVSAASAGAPKPVYSEALLVPAVQTPWPGKIFVSHDEWVLRDEGLAAAPDGQRLALNVAAWFTGGRPGKFVVYSADFGLTGATLAATMQTAGHTWVISRDVPFTMPGLLQYDAIFLAGNWVDQNVLTEYVRAGGHVYLALGTGYGPELESAMWNGFLNAFGLTMQTWVNYDRGYGVFAVTSDSPLFAGVSTLFDKYGSPIDRLSATDPNTKILVTYEGHGLFATYAAGVLSVAVEVCPGWLDLQNRESLSVSIAGTPDVDVRTIDATSVRLLGVAPRKSSVGYTVTPAVGPRLGKTAVSSCQAASDAVADLMLSFDNRDVERAAERLLGTQLDAGDLVVLTLTGRLKAEFGSTPIVGEGVVQIRDHGWAWGHQR